MHAKGHLTVAFCYLTGRVTFHFQRCSAAPLGALFIALGGLACLVGSAAAQASVTGNWRAGTTGIEVAVESWGSDCGPRPTSSRSGGGGVVTIEQRDQALLLHGRDQDIRTDTCWSRNPAMKRTLASYSNGQWLTRCRTADNDPRAEQGTYTLKLQDSETLLYKDTSRYDWSLNDSKCVATFTTTQTLTRATNANVSKAAATKEAAKESRPEPAASPRPELIEPTPTKAEVEEPSARGCRPGAPARMALKPKRAEIEVGQRVCFKVRVTDAADCNIPAPQVTFLLSHSKALRGGFVGGCFVAAEGAAEGAGEFKVLAKLGNLQADATVLVRRVDMSSLIARRMEGAGLTGMDETPGVADAAPKAVARIATHTAPPEQSSTQSVLLVGLGLSALTLTAIGFWVSRRKPALAASAPERDGAPAAHSGSNGGTPPAHLRPYDKSDTDDPDAAPPLAAGLPPSQRPDAGAAESWICPTCRVGYPAQQTTCPKDGTPLIPYVEFTQRRKRAELEHEKRCPKCGKTYPQSASFCGEDGSSLVEVGASLT